MEDLPRAVVNSLSKRGNWKFPAQSIFLALFTNGGKRGFSCIRTQRWIANTIAKQML